MLLPFGDLHGDHCREAEPVDRCREGATEIPPPVVVITCHPIIGQIISWFVVSQTQGLDVGEKPD